MPEQNGSGNTGGNSSVYWEMNGAEQKPATRGMSSSQAGPKAYLNVVDGPGYPSAGQLKVDDKRAAGHTTTNFDAIGRSNPPDTDNDHPGKFRVRLRFRDQDLDSLDAESRKWIMQRAKRMPELNPATASWFLEIDVPAIHRDQPDGNSAWAEQPWEIHWGW